MATYLTDKCTEIRKWLALGVDVYPDEVVTSWIRMAEEQLSTVLRVKHMIQIDTSDLTSERVPLPLDWQEIRLVRLPSTGVCRYQTSDAFLNPEYPDDPPGSQPADYKDRKYTILGNFLYIGNYSALPGTKIELSYYQNIPSLTNDNSNWINVYHPTVYTLEILHIASMYAIEDERGPMWDKEVVRTVNDMNNAHKVDQASGSVLMPVRKKSLGRKYGRLQYGRYTYDLFPSTWIPIPGGIFDEIWVPDPGVPAPPVEAWASAPLEPGEIWEPEADITASWTPVPFGSTEIWIPVTRPVL